MLEASILATKAKLLIPTHLVLYDINTANYGEVAEDTYGVNQQLPFYIFTPGNDIY